MEKGDQHNSRQRLVLMAIIIVALLAIAAAWRWTPLSEYIAPERLQQFMQGFENPYVRGGVAVAALTLALTVMVPLTILAVFAGIAFDGVLGFAYTFIAATASAALVFLAGRLLGQAALQKVGGKRVNRISEQLSDYGTLTVAVARLVPAAPFTVFNLVAGASHLTFRAFIAGTSIALAPGIGALTLFSSSVREAIRNPSAQTVAIVVVVLLVVITAVVLLKRRLSAND
ncbi:MAG: VTT domain-containing protein [Sphingomonadaceae bacterium]|nr:VTT domain-containing protein [Sphingomonadaceae bacterium]